MRYGGVISVGRIDAVWNVTVSNPPVNALNLALVEALQDLVTDFDHSTAKALVLRSGVPGHFASGAPLRSPTPGLEIHDPLDYRDALCDTLDAFARCRRPIIAAIDGRALGGGLELAMACTLRCASAEAQFGLPEVTDGMIPSGGGTQRLPALIGRGRALELMLSGRAIDSAEAERIGLVDRVLAGDVHAESLELATKLAGFAPAAIAAILCCVDAARDLSHEDGLIVERVALASLFEDAPAPETVATLIDQRRPAFG